MAKAKSKIQKHERRIDKPNAKCPRHPKKEYRLLVEAAWAAGWWCEKRRKYIYCFPSDKERDIVKIPMTPNKRTIRNVKASLVAAGLEL
jgi:hypothetical protein